MHLILPHVCHGTSYNEVAFLALNSVAPVTHAVGNTIKRVVIILASVIVFKTPMTTLGATGSAIAIFGYVRALNSHGPGGISQPSP